MCEARGPSSLSAPPPSPRSSRSRCGTTVTVLIYSTVQYSVQHAIAQYSTVQCSAVQYSTEYRVQYSTVPSPRSRRLQPAPTNTQLRHRSSCAVDVHRAESDSRGRDGDKEGGGWDRSPPVANSTVHASDVVWVGCWVRGWTAGGREGGCGEAGGRGEMGSDGAHAGGEDSCIPPTPFLARKVDGALVPRHSTPQMQATAGQAFPRRPPAASAARQGRPVLNWQGITVQCSTVQ